MASRSKVAKGTAATVGGITASSPTTTTTATTKQQQAEEHRLSQNVLTMGQVQQHATISDAWVVYRGVVYDVTGFVAGHPGGEGVLMEHLGTDISDVFDEGSEHTHTDAARGLLAEYAIGVLSSSARSGGAAQAGHHNVAVEFNPAIETIFLQKGDDFDLIDLEKPIVSQLWSTPMSLKQYLKVAHTPRFLKGGRVARFFENDILEYFSQNKWFSVLGWVPVVGLFVAYAGQHFALYQTAVLFGAGALLWTLMEYSLHRWLFHFDNWLPDNHFFICFHFLMHGVHHFLPMDPLRLVFPWPLTLIILVIFLQGMHFALGSWPLAIGMGAGTLAGYIAYDLTHYYIHHAVPPYRYFQSLKSYHLNHHYKDYQLGYGISSKFWDHVFGTVLY